MMAMGGKDRQDGPIDRDAPSADGVHTANKPDKYDEGDDHDDHNDRDGDDCYDDYKGISYGMILKKVARRSINDWSLFCDRVDNDNGDNCDYLRSALIQYCRHMRECFLKLLEINKLKKNYKEINDIIKIILEYKENYRELKNKYQYDLYICKVKIMDLQINESNVLCAIDLLSTGKYTRFPLLFKEILMNPSDSFIPNLDMNEINILKKRIVDEFLINYYSSKIPKDKVNFIFSDGLIELDVVNEVKVSLITDFVTWSIVKADIFFLRQMNLHSSHNLNLIRLVSYGVVQKMNEKMASHQMSEKMAGHQMSEKMAGHQMSEMAESVDLPQLDAPPEGYAPSEVSDMESSDSGDFLLKIEGDKKIQMKKMWHGGMNPIEEHYHRGREKRTQTEETLPLADVLYEIYRISHFYCTVQIMEYFKGCINQYNTFKYPAKKVSMYKCFSNNTIEMTPSCYNYSLTDKDTSLHLDIHLYEFEFTKGMYECFEKIPLLDQYTKKKMILKFVLNNENGDIKMFLWPFSFFKKGEKENFFTNDILSHYEFVYCGALQRRMKNLFIFDSAHIHLESWLSRVDNCVTRFLFSILKAFSTSEGESLHGVCNTDHLKSSETSFENNAIGVHELIQDYFFHLGYIRMEVRCKDSLTDGERNNGKSNNRGDVKGRVPTLQNRIKTVLVRKKNGNPFFLLRYTFYEQKINLFLSRQSEKFTFICHWKSKAFIDMISLHYDLKLIIYVVYLLKRFSLYVYMYKELQERFLNINAGRVFTYELDKDKFCSNFFVEKLKLHDLLKKYNYSANIVLTKFLQSFLSFIDFYFYLPCDEEVDGSIDGGDASKGTTFEKALRKLVQVSGGEKSDKWSHSQGNSHLGRRTPSEANRIDNLQGINLDESNFSETVPLQKHEGSGYNEETPQEEKKSSQPQDPFRQNFFSLFYFTIYTYDHTPLLLILLIEKDCIYKTYIVISDSKGGSLGIHNLRSEEGKSKKGYFFTIPVIHRSYPIGSHLEDYLDGVRDMVNRFSNLFCTLGKLLQMNSRCPVFCSRFCVNPSTDGKFSGRVVQSGETSHAGDTAPRSKSTLKLASDQMYERLKKEKNKGFLDLQYFVNRNQWKRAPRRESGDVGQEKRNPTDVNPKDHAKEKYPADYINNYLLHLECEQDAEQYLNREFLNNHERSEFPIIIKVNTCGSFFFEVPIQQKKLLKIRDLDLKRNKEVSFMLSNVAVNVEVEPLGGEGTQGPPEEWVQMKKMYLLLKDDSSSANILHLFSVMNKIFSVLNFFPELYYLEKIMTPDISIRICHLANINVEYHCGFNKQITCSVVLDILNGGDITSAQLDDPSGGLHPANGGQNKEHISKSLGEGDANSMTPNRRIEQTSDKGETLEKLLFFDIAVNSPFECINKLFSREKKKLFLYLKKKKSIFSFLRFLFLTFEFHYNFYILINRTNEHLMKIPFLHQVDLLHDIEFDYVNLMTVMVTLKSFRNEKGVLSFYVILHPEDFSKIVIIPHYRDTSLSRHQRREISVKNFFKRGKRQVGSYPRRDDKGKYTNEEKRGIIQQRQAPTNNIPGMLSSSSPHLENGKGIQYSDRHADQCGDQHGSSPKKSPLNHPNENDTTTVEGTFLKNGVPSNTKESGILIDHLDEEDLFIYLFSHFCDIINLKRVNQSTIYTPSGDLHSGHVNPQRDSSNPLEGIEYVSLGDGAMENDVKIFEEYDLFILNIKYLFKMKNQIVLSEVFFFPPFFLYTTLYPFVEFLKALKCWLVLLGQMKLHHSDITLMLSDIGDVFQHVTAVRRRCPPATVLEGDALTGGKLPAVDSPRGANQKANTNSNANQKANANSNANQKANANSNANVEMQSGQGGAPSQGHTKGHRHDNEIVVHLVWFLYSTKDLYVDTTSPEEGKTCKRSYSAILGDSKEVNQEGLQASGDGNSVHGKDDHSKGHYSNGSEHKKVKIQEEDGEHNAEDNFRGDEHRLREVISDEIQNVKWENETDNPVGKKYTHTTNYISTPFHMNQTNMDKLKHMINAYSHFNDDIFLKKKYQKIWLGENFIQRAYALRIVEPQNAYPPYKEGKLWNPLGEEGKSENIGNDHHEDDALKKMNTYKVTTNCRETQNDCENMFFFNREKIQLGFMEKGRRSASSGENMYKGDMHYWTNSVGIYFENVGESVDEEDCWFYRSRGKVPTRDGQVVDNHGGVKKTRKFILEEQNILKENSKINSALNIIYNYARIWLLKMNHSNVISFFRIVNEIIFDKKNICELSSLLFNSVLSYREHLTFWMFRTTEGVSMPFVEMEFVPDEGVDELIAVAGEKKRTSIFRNKWIEVAVPVEEAVYGGYLVEGERKRGVMANLNGEETHTGGDLPTPSRGNQIITTGGGNDGKGSNFHPIPATEKTINIIYKIWKYMPAPFKKKIYEQEVKDIMGGANESVTLTFKISSVLPIKNLKEVHINDEPFVKFLVRHKIDLNVAHQRVMTILQKYNLMANYSLVATQTVLHRSTFELLLKGKNNDGG
ncbi:Cg2-like protein [Plasmodium knowlesi strain H]|uniref:Mediator of RNA polymerase II transcription subunit 14 n=3 Tax=Plasmodium knowlesi TaxID=5850 RepID=A0A5K1VQ50_PLAKH|nr:Cg2 protein, putative [Plasmodium knowlesi strain H]OTN68767.1 Cg2-like protein [Plasmodium knowlesi]CAA9986159.1 Cg2 protein, putative [Plasmodium knowlesi strain H]SBO25348.1 Cg2-like protein [Plasmodium knowlesi strain H]SBO27654.1 Cg2-like protein [Plasmodium knowlesi strain H]VVS75633.1 Cg2 protein, putative [Plasmodium knowlesi strain H]|eukprot:XP_002257570.1 Cg2-like protein [Plasmodium knowlesi strain H]